MARSLAFLSSAVFLISRSVLFVSPVSAEVEAPIPPINDRCVNATDIIEFDVPIANSTLNASFDGYNQGSCGPRTDRKAVWFSVAGTGNKLTASVCTTNNVITDFGVFNECNSLENCNGYAPQQLTPASCVDDKAASYTWESAKGNHYYIHVRADVVSEFNITISEEVTESQKAKSGSTGITNGIVWVLLMTTACASALVMILG